MTEISQPHDRFFKELFAYPEAGRDFLKHYLPENIAGILDADSFELTKDSFVDKELRENFSDILGKVRLKDGTKAYIYILLEHKSYPEPLTGFQLLRYMVRIWERSVRKYESDKRKNKTSGDKPFYLPVIIPIVIYHGESEWNISKDFISLFDIHPALKFCIPDFSYLPFDISHYSNDEIKGAVILRSRIYDYEIHFQKRFGRTASGNTRSFAGTCRKADRNGIS